MPHDHVLKKLNFDLLNPFPGGGRGVCGHNICYHVASFPCSEKVEFLPTDPIPRVGVSVGKIFATMLLHS